MLSLLKVFFRGVLTTLALPLILLVWVLYGIYCIGLFIFMFFKSVIDYFLGKTFTSELPEDLEARRMILEKEKAEEERKERMDTMYQNVFAQPKTITPESAQQEYQQQNPYAAPEINTFEQSENDYQSSEELEENEESQDDLRNY